MLQAFWNWAIDRDEAKREADSKARHAQVQTIAEKRAASEPSESTRPFATVYDEVVAELGDPRIRTTEEPSRE